MEPWCAVKGRVEMTMTNCHTATQRTRGGRDEYKSQHASHLDLQDLDPGMDGRTRLIAIVGRLADELTEKRVCIGEVIFPSIHPHRSSRPRQYRSLVHATSNN